MANGEEMAVIQRSFVLNKDQIDYLSHGGTGTIPLVAGQYTPIISWKVPRQEKLGLIQNPRVTMKLYDTNGNELPGNTKLMISIRKPTQQLTQEIGNYKFYNEYQNLEWHQQLSGEYDNAVRFEMMSAGFFPEESELVVLANVPESGITLNWDDPRTQINIGRTGQPDLVRIEV